MREQKTEAIYKNKRFLIAQPIIYSINGSTLVTLELAEFLQSQGAEVIVYTCILGEPAKDAFEKCKITVLEPETANHLKLKDFDYIWVHSQIMPPSILQDLAGKHSPAETPRFIFLHMSGLDYLPDEFPWIPYLEEKLCDKKLCISEGTGQAQAGFFDDAKKEFDFFRNPAPAKFKRLRENKINEPRKILLVSNHPVSELQEAINILKEEGLVVQTFGEGKEKYHIISPEDILGADIVITIGKTVQYCLLSQTPVYIYDHFGGPGYLTDENYEQAKSHNFSGRSFNKKTSGQIVQEIKDGFAKNQEFLAENYQNFVSDFSLEKVLPRILTFDKKKSKKQLEIGYANSAIRAQNLATNYFRVGANNWYQYKELKRLTAENERLCAELNEIRSSRSYKLLSKVAKIRCHYQSQGKKSRNNSQAEN